MLNTLTTMHPSISPLQLPLPNSAPEVCLLLLALACNTELLVPALGGTCVGVSVSDTLTPDPIAAGIRLNRLCALLPFPLV